MVVDEIIKIAENAASEIMKFYEAKDYDVKVKSDNSPVTDADMASHNLICKRLAEISEYPILSEENPVEYNIRKGWNRYWLVDPLDGTKDFIKRTDDFTVNIALIENGEPVLGVVVIPARSETYYAEKGKGAFKKTKEATTKIYADSSRTKLCCAVSRFHLSDETVDFCKRHDIEAQEAYGSSLKLCKIAEGTVDVYPRLSPTMEWDIAAGHCIVNEGGGHVLSCVTKEPLRYNKESLLNDSFVAQRRDLMLF